MVERDPLLARLLRVPEVGQLPVLADFDPRDDGQLDVVASALLQRFRRAADTEAFTLLFELTHTRLVQIAAGITQRLSPATDPDDVTAGFMARLFSDVGSRRRQAVRRFLALARVAMRNAVLDHLRHQRRARVGALRYRHTLHEPRDPAEQADHQEQDVLLQRYGTRLVSTVGRCFAQLEARDQRVLVAREILGLSYDRVAAALGLERGQVGMIIRRARQHLADRIVQRLTARGHRLASEGSAAGEEGALDGAQAEVLRRLLCPDRMRHVPPLVQRMLDLSAVAARARLADLVYELAKGCLLAAPGASERLLVAAPPRTRAVVVDEVQRLTRRLSGMQGAEPTTQPNLEGDALTDARRCLAVLGRLEGESGRRQVALALVEIHAGEPEAAEAILRPLVDADLPPLTRCNVVRNLTLSLLRQERFTDARQLASHAADEWPDDPVRITNLCFCAARLGDVPAFERHLVELAEVQRATPSDQVGAWLDTMLPALASEIGLDAERLAGLLAGPDESGGTRG